MKQDFQRAVLNRIPLMEREPAHRWREVLVLCDECQSFATAGESGPTGDEKFFAIAVSQMHSHCGGAVDQFAAIDAARGSWRMLLQAFRIKNFLARSDDLSERTASELCCKTSR